MALGLVTRENDDSTIVLRQELSQVKSVLLIVLSIGNHVVNVLLEILYRFHRTSDLEEGQVLVRVIADGVSSQLLSVECQLSLA